MVDAPLGSFWQHRCPFRLQHVGVSQKKLLASGCVPLRRAVATTDPTCASRRWHNSRRATHTDCEWELLGRVTSFSAGRARREMMPATHFRRLKWPGNETGLQCPQVERRCERLNPATKDKFTSRNLAHDTIVVETGLRLVHSPLRIAVFSLSNGRVVVMTKNGDRTSHAVETVCPSSMRWHTTLGV